MRVAWDPPETAAERLYVIGGTALAVAGMLRRSTAGGLGLMLLGGAFVVKGLQTRDATIEAAKGCVTPEIPDEHGVPIEYTIVVTRQRPLVYGYWRNLENLPRFMPHLVSVREHGEGKSTWVAKGPKDGTITWDAEIVADEPGKLLAWRSLPGAVVRNQGAVYFYDAPNDRTEVRLYMEVHPPLGAVGLKAAHWLGEDPVDQIRGDLERFKSILESASPVNFVH
jgi:uncharacterized membrane protein